MKRLQSIKLKVKQSTSSLASKTGLVDSESRRLSVSTILSLAVDPSRPGPTAQQLHAVAKYSWRGEAECLKLKRLVLKQLTLCGDTGRQTELLRLLTLLDYVFVCGAPEFYYLFVNGDAHGDVGEGVWKLRVLDGTLTGGDPVLQRIRDHVAELRWVCADYDHWQTRRAQYESIRQEIHLPASRHSFDSSATTLSVPTPAPASSLSPPPPTRDVRRAHTVHAPASLPTRSSSSLYRGTTSLGCINEE